MKKETIKRTNGVCDECGAKVATIRVVKFEEGFIVASVCCGCDAIHDKITSFMATRQEAVYIMDKALHSNAGVKKIIYNGLCKVADKVKSVHLGTKLKSISSRLPRVKVSITMPSKKVD